MKINVTFENDQEINKFIEIFNEEPVINSSITLQAETPASETITMPTDTAPVGSIPINNMGGTIPTTTTAKDYTKEQLARALGDMLDQGRHEKIFELLAKYDTNALDNMDPKYYNDLAAQLTAIGVKIDE